MDGRTKVRRATVVWLSIMSICGVLTGYDLQACADNDDPGPISAIDSTAGGQYAKRGLTNRMFWALYTPVTHDKVFDVYDHRTFISWGYNDAGSIPWIDKSSQGRCLTPVGSCGADYGFWYTEVCDRTGQDTCLFRHENGGHASFTYGVAFNKIMISCNGTRINGDGSHVRNTWEGDCAGGAAALAVKATPNLTVGEGANEVRLGDHLSRAEMRSLNNACFEFGTADEAKCKKVALRAYDTLPQEVQRKVERGLSR